MSKDIFIKIGFSKEKAEKLNKDVNQLAKDLADFENTTLKYQKKRLGIIPRKNEITDLIGILYSSKTIKKNSPYFFRLFPIRFIPKKIKARSIIKLIEKYKDE